MFADTTAIRRLLGAISEHRLEPALLVEGTRVVVASDDPAVFLDLEGGGSVDSGGIRVLVEGEPVEIDHIDIDTRSIYLVEPVAVDTEATVDYISSPLPDAAVNAAAREGEEYAHAFMGAHDSTELENKDLFRRAAIYAAASFLADVETDRLNTDADRSTLLLDAADRILTRLFDTAASLADKELAEELGQVGATYNPGHDYFAPVSFIDERFMRGGS